MMGKRKGLRIDTQWCNGCYSCVIACKQEHNYPPGVGGIIIQEVETPSKKLTDDPELMEKLVEWSKETVDTGDPENYRSVDNVPITTQYCNLCATRVSEGKEPACVKACQTDCMEFGPIEDLSEDMEEGSVLYIPPSG